MVLVIWRRCHGGLVVALGRARRYRRRSFAAKTHHPLDLSGNAQHDLVRLMPNGGWYDWE